MNIQKFCIVISIFFIKIILSEGFEEFYKEKPEFLKQCKIYQPEFTKCATESVQGLMDHIAKNGLPELTAKIGTIDPISVDRIDFKQDNNQAVTLEASLYNLMVTGLSKIKIKEHRVSKKDFSWQGKMLIPKFHIEGDYKMKGKILIIPLNGSGKFYVNMDNMDIKMNTKTRLIEKGGFTFYNITNIHIDWSMTKAESNFDNIFNGNKEIESSINQFFNENWRDFFDALRPLLNESIEKTLIKILKACFDILPANFLIEDIPTPTELYGKENA